MKAYCNGKRISIKLELKDYQINDKVYNSVEEKHFFENNPYHRKKCLICIDIQHNIWHNHIINCNNDDCSYCDWLYNFRFGDHL